MEKLKNLLIELRKQESNYQKNEGSYEKHILLIDVIFELEYIEYGLENIILILNKHSTQLPGKVSMQLIFYLSGVLLHIRILRDTINAIKIPSFEKAGAIMNRVIAHSSLGAVGARRLKKIEIKEPDIYIEYFGDRDNTKDTNRKKQDDLLDNAIRTGKFLGEGDWMGIGVATSNGDFYIGANQFAGSTLIFQEIIHPIIGIIYTKYR